ANPRELEAYRYLTHWYYVAIREMASLPGFRAEPRWVAPRLRGGVSVKEAEQALEFLREFGFLREQPDGSVALADKDIKCIGGVYRLALAQFHREMLALISRLLPRTPREERFVAGHTFAIPRSRFPELR